MTSKTMKTIGKNTSKSLQLVEGKEIKSTPTPTPIRVTNLRAAKRLLSRLIYQLQSGEIQGTTAKDLTYLLSVFVNIFKQMELEERLNLLEQKLK